MDPPVLFAVPDKIIASIMLDFIERSHAVPPIDPPPAALGLATIPNTEVKLMYADDLLGDCPGR